MQRKLDRQTKLICETEQEYLQKKQQFEENRRKMERSRIYVTDSSKFTRFSHLSLFV